MKLDSATSFLNTLKNMPKWIVLMIFLCAMSYFFSDTISFYIKNRKADPVKIGINQSNLVNSVLVEMLTEFEANRAYVYRFHNGVNYYDGNHKVKLSMDFEKVSKGVSSIGLLMQDVTASLFSNQIQSVINEELLYANVSNLKDHGSASLLRDFGVKNIAMLSYYDEHNRLILMVGLHWMGKEDPEFIVERFRAYVTTIGNILTNKEYKEMFALNGVTRGGIQSIKTEVTYSPSFLSIHKAELYRLVTKANTPDHQTD